MPEHRQMHGCSGGQRTGYAAPGAVGTTPRGSMRRAFSGPPCITRSGCACSCIRRSCT